jgi:hypothetical protein
VSQEQQCFDIQQPDCRQATGTELPPCDSAGLWKSIATGTELPPCASAGVWQSIAAGTESQPKMIGIFFKNFLDILYIFHFNNIAEVIIFMHILTIS